VKHFRAPATLFGGLVVVALVAGTALAKTSVFSASYTGMVTEKVNGQMVTAVPRGKGAGTLIGKSTLTGTVAATTADPPCSPLKGPGLLAGKAGKLKVTLLPTARACAAGEEDRNNISFAGSAKVIGGTGKFRAAKGTLRFSGRYDRSNGAFTVKLRGTLKY
jgi:hypothetical protein